MAEVLGVNTCAKLEGVYIREKGIQEVVTQTCGSALVKPTAVSEVVLSLTEYPDLHFVESRTFCLASTQSTNWEEPSCTLFSRFRRMSACQDGDGTSSGRRQRLSQIISSARSFSAVVICSIDRVRSMGNLSV
jgi:hypothetical protein